MKTDNTKTQMRKGILEYCILLTMENKPQYSSDIIVEMEKSRLIITGGTRTKKQ